MLKESGITNFDLYIAPIHSKNVIILINQNSKFQLLDPFLSNMCIALLQQAAPLIVSQRMLREFCARQKAKDSIEARIKVDDEWRVFKEPTGDFYLLIPHLLINNTSDKTDDGLLDRLGFSKSLVKVKMAELEKDVNSAKSWFYKRWLKKVSASGTDYFFPEKFNLRNLESFFELNSGLWNIYLGGHGINNISVAGMPIKDFKEFVQFLSSRLHVYFLYYTTCYAGGLNLITPFKNFTTNFVIAQESTTASITYPILIRSPDGGPYPLCEHSLCLDPALYSKKSISFSRFFNALEQDLQNVPVLQRVDDPELEVLSYDPWRIILNYIAPVQKWREASDTPLIKFGGTEFFRASELGTSIKTVTEATKRACEFEGNEIVITDEIRALLWYPAICNVNLVLGYGPLNMVFMNPEKSLHYFKCIKAEKLTLSKFNEQILWRYDLRTEKIVVVKELRLKDGVVLHDCVFVLSYFWEAVAYLIFTYKDAAGKCYLDEERLAFKENLGRVANISMETLNYLEQKRSKLMRLLKYSKYSEAKYKKYVASFLDAYARYKPQLTRNGQLVASWQENPKKLVAYVKKQLFGEPSLTDDEKKMVEEIDSMASRVGMLKEVLQRKLTTQPAKSISDEGELSSDMGAGLGEAGASVVLQE